MLKRTFDVLVSLLALVVFSPIMAAIALAIRATSPGPVFHHATRTGLGGRPFTLHKFRSMVVDAQTQGAGVTGAHDRRVTPVGRILRRTKLDELPQFYNVLRGDMSLVGPRPEDPRYVAFYTADQRLVLKVRPGITSPASVSFRNEEAILSGDDPENRYIREILPMKLTIDLDYVRNPSFSSDIVILFRTIASLFR